MSVLHLFLSLAMAGLSVSQEIPPLPEELEAAYQYLFSMEEQQSYDRLTSEEEKLNFWRTYWQRQDPTPETDHNELLQLFRRRFNELLYFQETAGFVRGWRGKRGRFYLIYGAPQEIHKSYKKAAFMDDAMKEVWVYKVYVDGTENVAEITFIDEENNGLYKLKTPVKFARSLSILPRLPEIDFKLELR